MRIVYKKSVIWIVKLIGGHRSLTETGREPRESGCPCPTCTTDERAHVHHLVRSAEILGAMMMTEHNLWFYQRMMQGMREAIGEGRLAAYAAAFLDRYRAKESSA